MDCVLLVKRVGYFGGHFLMMKTITIVGTSIRDMDIHKHMGARTGQSDYGLKVNLH